MCHKLAYDPTKRSHEYFWSNLVKSLGSTTAFDPTIVKDLGNGTAEVIAPSASKPSRETSPKTPQDSSSNVEGNTDESKSKAKEKPSRLKFMNKVTSPFSRSKYDKSKGSPELISLPSVLSTPDADKRSNDSGERWLPSVLSNDPGRDGRLRNRGSVGDRAEEERQANVQVRVLQNKRSSQVLLSLTLLTETLPQPPSTRRKQGKGNRQ